MLPKPNQLAQPNPKEAVSEQMRSDDAPLRPTSLAAPDASGQQKRAIVNSEAAGPQDVSRLVKMRMQPQDPEQSQRTFSFNQQYQTNALPNPIMPNVGAPHKPSLFAKPSKHQRPSSSVSDSSRERLQQSSKRQRHDHSEQPEVRHQTISGEVGAMKREILKISRTFDGFINSQSNIFGKMNMLEGENIKLKMVNEELLQQLISAEERQQMYEKLVTTVLQFFRTKRNPALAPPSTLQQQIAGSSTQPLAI